MNDWYARWFGKEYLELYPHRDEAEAAAAVQLIRRTLGADLPERTLDLACGSGRHSRALRQWTWTVGFDLSTTLLEVARAEEPVAPYVRGDMRVLPFSNGVFRLVVNLFTSFGYFATDEEHQNVLDEVARVTSVGGIFVLDYFNADAVRHHLVPHDERIVNGRRIVQERSISADGRYVEKVITADHCNDRFLERVRLFSGHDLHTMLTASGFVVKQTYGNYRGDPCTADSPRVMLIAERQ